jgi:hypothetical protein
MENECRQVEGRIGAKKVVVAIAVGRTFASMPQYVVERILMSDILLVVPYESVSYLRGLNDVEEGER